MVYGIISGLDNETTKAVFKQKKISMDRVVHSSKLHYLLNVLKAGDSVHVISVNRFINTIQLLEFGRFCMCKGVNLHILSQPYLSISSGRHWKPSTLKLMEQIIHTEDSAIQYLSKGFRMNDSQWRYMCHSLEMLSLEILANTFASDGVLKRSDRQ